MPANPPRRGCCLPRSRGSTTGRRRNRAAGRRERRRAPAACAAAAPDAVALIDDAGETTYAALLEQCDRHAAALVALGVRQGDVVAVCAGRTAATLRTVLALFRIGAVYLLDPALPEARHRFMVDDARPVAIVGDAAAPTCLRACGVRFVEQVALAEAGLAALAAAPRVSPGDPAYILYTSGSTGTPKGVCRQEGILALFDALARIAGRGRPRAGRPRNRSTFRLPKCCGR